MTTETNEPSDLITCHICGGTGLFLKKVQGSNGTEMFDEECRECKGSGYIDPKAPVEPPSDKK